MADREPVVLCTVGTRGDLDPFFALADGLIGRGYRVILLSNTNWREDSIHVGCEFVSIAHKDESQCGRDDHDFFIRCTLPVFKASYAVIERMVQNGVRPTLLYRSNMVGVECAARNFGLLSGSVALQPSAIRSTLRPPWPLTRLTVGRFGLVGRKLVVPALYGVSESLSPYRRYSNRFRHSVRLKAPSKRNELEHFSLLLCPRWFALPQADWPGNLYLPGFVFRTPANVEPDVRSFLDEHDPPLVFTPGTGVSDTEWFFERAAEVVSRTSMPAIFLSQHIPERFLADSRILCRGFADLGSILPRARAIFHHGGIGTTAQAIRARIPQIIIPGRFDQPDNAMRVAMLGLGASIMSDEYSGRDWSELLRRTLDSMHVAGQVSTASQLVANEHGLDNVIRIIEYHLADRASAA